MHRSGYARRLTKTHPVLRSTLEMLERRLQLDATYHTRAGGSFSQDWTNASLITTNNDWSGVPSIIGYRGDDLTTATGTDPQTILAPGIAPTDTPPGVVNVLANQTNPNTLTTGGVAEFDTLTNPVVALQASGTADAPFLLLHINSTGVANVKVSYLLRDIDGSADNAVQPVALQYRVGTSGNFINVPDAFVPDASTGPNLAVLETPVSVTLPAGAGNQPQLQIRIITSNAAGNDEWIGIDNIVVSDAPASAGAIRFDVSSYSVNETAGNATITLTRVGGDAGAVSVRAQTVAGGTATPGSDYTVVDTIVNFANNQTSASFLVPIVNDTLPEPAETVALEISNPTGGATLGSITTATLTIIDNDSTAPAGLVLNEVLVNPAGTDNPFEYAELRGAASQSLFNTYFVSVEGDAESAPGAITLLQNLSAFNLGSNGLLMIKSPTGGFVPPGATTVVTNAALDNAGGGLQNGSNSFLVIFSPIPLTNGQDLDTDNDGTLDLPPGASLVDGVAWVDGTNVNDRAYGGAVLTLVSGFQPPDAASRFVGNNSQNNDQAWFFGDMTGTNDSVEYNQTTVTTTNPSGIPSGTVVLTPGDVNYSGALTATADFVFDAFPTPQTIRIVFSGNVGGSLDVTDITLTNLTTSTTISPSQISLVYDGGTNTARFTFPSFPLNGSLPDGNYSLLLPAGNVSPALAADVQLSFFAFAGDANRDRSINLGDFAILAARFNLAGTFTQGDFNYNGVTELGDFAILAGKFNATLPAPAGLPRVALLTSGLFSSTRLSEKLERVSEGLIA
ncbi:MAG: hypothetical protein NZ561_09465 [Phycisphaerae bacterium]|nr:hypothetical protein [Phycisphaerae bacterium]